MNSLHRTRAARKAAACLPRLISLFAVMALLLPGALRAQAAPAAAPDGAVPTPVSHFGFEPGTDRKLADWDELSAYYDKLARSSDRVTIDTLGATTQGRPMVMLTITSAANQARIGELHEIQMKLADPRTISGPAELERLKDAGRTVVLITQQIHSTEVGGGQMAPNLLYRLASANDDKVREILDNVILLHVPSLNPDGTDMVSEWYREHAGTDREGAPPPFLYHPYVGHDNNRDWYAFTQKETVLAITGAHNAWHPAIVHDVHQMGSNGARIFLPPFVDPVEPNVDPLIIASINQLGSYMAAEMMSQGKKGVVINAQYDLFTPARAYQHYHGGARILSETASARLATPIQIPAEQLRGARGFNATERSWNFPDPWEGGTWGLPQIVDYMESAAMALLTNAARNRRFWLENFVTINQRAIDGWESWPEAWVIPAGQDNEEGVNAVLRILTMGDVEVHRAESGFNAAGRSFPSGSYVIPMKQPYASFAQTMLELQEYPTMLEYEGGPPVRPYDVTAHTLPLLMDMEAVAVAEPLSVALSGVIPVPALKYTAPAGLTGRRAPRVGIYKGWDEPMTAGWTRWVFDQHGIRYDTLGNATIQSGNLARSYDVIVMQGQSRDDIVDGWAADAMPAGFSGGIGEPGLAALGDFVRAGGRLIAIEEATDLAIEALDLPVRNAVADIDSREFYIPGSILRLNVDTGSQVGRGTDAETAAWFWRSSRSFAVTGDNAEVIARYGEGDPRLSGWVLGAERIAGEPAIVEATVGRGSVVLFGFQPNYRAQSIATWPLLFNAMMGK